MQILRSFSMVVLGFSLLACSGGGGVEGDSCVSTRDCAGGYNCRGLRCTLGNFGAPVTGKECVALQCAIKTDCLGSQECRGGQCVCTADTDCAGQYCLNGKCVQCTSDTHCGANVCMPNNVCGPKCDNDFACPAFYKCSSGKCSYAGCTTHRECIWALDDATAVCDTKTTPATCKIPCQSHFDCSAGAHTGYNQLTCAGGYCTSIGCDSVEDCRAGNPQIKFGYECRTVTP
jgi:hypothetical protein